MSQLLGWEEEFKVWLTGTIADRAKPVDLAKAAWMEAWVLGKRHSEKQRESWPLWLQGRSTDLIWLMMDGEEPHCIGIRMDCGDSGTVYVTRQQAEDLIGQLRGMLDVIDRRKIICQIEESGQAAPKPGEGQPSVGGVGDPDVKIPPPNR